MAAEQKVQGLSVCVHGEKYALRGLGGHIRVEGEDDAASSVAATGSFIKKRRGEKGTENRGVGGCVRALLV